MIKGILGAAAAAVAAAALSGAPASAQQAGSVGVELNKLEDFDGGCRSFFLFRNRSERAYSAFELSLAILNGEGVIDRLLTIDAAPLPAARTTLKIFEIGGLACADIGEIILHDMAACAAADGEAADCFAAIELVSRASAPLVK